MSFVMDWRNGLPFDAFIIFRALGLLVRLASVPETLFYTQVDAIY